MTYFVREIYYFIINSYNKFKSKKVKLGFRAKTTMDTTFEGYNKIGHHSFFSGHIGMASYIGEESIIIGKVGRYSSIGGHVKCLTLTHPTKKFVSTSPCFYSVKKQSGFTFVKEKKFEELLTIEGEKESIIIGNDVYIGYGVTLIAPVKIGDGAIIAAGSVVTHDIEPYTIVGGNPAKIIRKRFKQEQIDFLLKLCWWDKDTEWIAQKANLFEDISKFIEHISE